MLDAQSKQDNAALMDTQLPANRRVFNPLNLLSQVNLSGGAGPLSINIPLQDLARMTFRNVTYQAVEIAPAYVLVQANGQIRLEMLQYEADFCEQYDVKQEGGAWYVDLYAPERNARTQQLIAQQQALLASASAATPDPNLDPLTNLFQTIGAGLEASMDHCP